MRVLLKALTLILCTCSILFSTPAFSQFDQKPFPKEVFTAKTVIIFNDTHTDGVEEGAVEQLKKWGHFTVVDDSDNADIILRFDKNKEHDGRNTQKTDDKGNSTDYGYSMTFSTQIHMKAYLKGSDTPFYTTKTDDSKKKAGTTCVTNFQSAYLVAR
jgi:hypothetical protein